MSGKSRPRLLLVGGGHAHIQVLRDFARSPPDCRVTVLVDRPLAMYSGMVPGFVAGQYTRAELTFDLRVWAERLGAALVLDRAIGIDPQLKVVHREQGDPLPYDVCSWNIGSTVFGLQLAGVQEHALPTRPIGDFVDHVHVRLDAAIAARRGAAVRVVLVGGGRGGGGTCAVPTGTCACERRLGGRGQLVLRRCGVVGRQRVLIAPLHRKGIPASRRPALLRPAGDGGARGVGPHR